MDDSRFLIGNKVHQKTVKKVLKPLKEKKNSTKIKIQKQRQNTFLD